MLVYSEVLVLPCCGLNLYIARNLTDSHTQNDPLPLQDETANQ